MTPPSALPCVTRDLLERNAAVWPELVVLKFDTGQQYTCTELLAAVRQQAAGLQALGVVQDDYVLSWLGNGPLAVITWLALNYLGAVYVPINTAYKGRLLQHVVQNSGARLLIADGRLIGQLAVIAAPALRQVVVIGPERPALVGITLLPATVLQGDAGLLHAPPRTIQAWDTQCVIFTSGTTGPSKGVLCSYRHTATAAREFRHVGPGDCNLVALPMFHIGGILGVNFALLHGGTAAVVERFRTDSFWRTVQDLGVTTVGLLGTMVQFLMQQPVRDGEGEHTLRTAVIAPFGADAIAFGARFGIDVYTEFNMTELSVPLYCGPNPTVRGTCGKPRAGVTLQLVDAHDTPVAAGTIGELILRTDEPWTLSHGYLNDPVATANSWRNGWFHTGDLFYHDSNNNYFFVDRVKDMIRRRGENISSFEVEAELLACPGVKAAAAVAVPGDGGEDEVLAVLSLIAGASLDPAALIAFLQPRLANFMIPRYVRIMAELPLTPTQKIEKHVIRAAGITLDTWDRDAAGIRLQRVALGERDGAQDNMTSQTEATGQDKVGDCSGERNPDNALENSADSIQTPHSENSLRSPVTCSDTAVDQRASNADAFTNRTADKADSAAQSQAADTTAFAHLAAGNVDSTARSHAGDANTSTSLSAGNVDSVEESPAADASSFAHREASHPDSSKDPQASNSATFANPESSNAATYLAASTASTNNPAAKPSGPLVGVKVLEFSGLGPAPFCCMLLSDMGADVVRIDKPGTLYAAADVEARGRTSICLNLKTPEGKADALALMQHADIVIEGFRPGVMERLGLGPDIVLGNNPRLIYGRMTGWGQRGPQAHKAGHDLNYLALTGALHALGSKDKPAVPLNLIADFGGGALYLAMGVLAALHHVRESGSGQVVDCAMTDGVLSMLAMIYGDLADGRWLDQRESNVIDGAAPFYNVYQCADGNWLALACIEAQFYQKFIEVAQLPRSSFAEQWNREHWPQMKHYLEQFFLTRSRDEWCSLFATHDVCLEPVLSLTEAQQHPQNRERNAFITRDAISQPAPAPRFSVTPSQVQNDCIASSNNVVAVLNKWRRE